MTSLNRPFHYLHSCSGFAALPCCACWWGPPLVTLSCASNIAVLQFNNAAQLSLHHACTAPKKCRQIIMLQIATSAFHVGGVCDGPQGTAMLTSSVI